MTPRHLTNWLRGLNEYVEETESPRTFWLWGGLFTIASALQRRVWIPFGFDNLFPNLYIMIIAPPGRCRKGSPVGLAKKMLSDDGVQIPVFADSPTKRALTKQLAELAGTSYFSIKGPDGTTEHKPQAPLALVSKELSSFFATNPKEMIEILTDLFDSHDVWEYKTSEKGTDKLYGVCINCIFASTPSWIANNLPEESVGGGFTSRFVVVPGFEKYKFVPIPKTGDPELYKNLIHDLGKISRLAGEFSWEPSALTRYKEWYLTIEGKVRQTHDERMHAYLERMHIIAIKVAMCLCIAESDKLLLHEQSMSMAIALVEEVLENAPAAFGSLGRSNTALLTDEVRKIIRVTKSIDFGELFKYCYRNTNRAELKEVLRGLQDMEQVSILTDYKDGREHSQITWIGRK